MRVHAFLLLCTLPALLGAAPSHDRRDSMDPANPAYGVESAQPVDTTIDDPAAPQDPQDTPQDDMGFCTQECVQQVGKDIVCPHDEDSDSDDDSDSDNMGCLCKTQVFADRFVPCASSNCPGSNGTAISDITSKCQAVVGGALTITFGNVTDGSSPSNNNGTAPSNGGGGNAGTTPPPSGTATTPTPTTPETPPILGPQQPGTHGTNQTKTSSAPAPPLLTASSSWFHAGGAALAAAAGVPLSVSLSVLAAGVYGAVGVALAVL